MDLRTGKAFWPIASGLIHTYPPLETDAKADVLVIGAGITGALCADALTRAGHSVVVLDRRDAATGSTSASTALLQYEIDTNLVDLAQMIGQRDAERAYQLCREAIDMVGELARSLPDDCGFKEQGSLYYASSKKDARMLKAEYAARRAAGFDLEWLDAGEVQQQFGIRAPAALYSKAGAEVDPYRLAQSLLWRALGRGAQVYDRTTVTDLQETGRSFMAQTDRGHAVRAKWVIVAAGYEAETFLGRRLAQLKNSYALASEPVQRKSDQRQGELWPTGCLIWETARPYLYARTSQDGRVIVGGLDDDFVSPAHRERVLRRKTRGLEKKMAKLLPNLPLETAFSWAGTFGETPDGLAYIGPQEKGSRLLFALGYGGNGITYSVQAARMLTEHIGGKTDPDMQIFGLNR